jgi:hypothetical protein
MFFYFFFFIALEITWAGKPAFLAAGISPP